MMRGKIGMDKKWHIESKLAQIGSVEEPVTGAVNYPIYQATAFRHPRLGHVITSYSIHYTKLYE